MKSFQRFFCIALFAGFVGISHLVLPYWNESKDFFVFAPWNMFAGVAKMRVLDFQFSSCGGKFLFRDLRALRTKNGFEWLAMFHSLNQLSSADFVKRYSRRLSLLSECRSGDAVELKGSLFDHIIQKKDLEVLHREHYEF